MNFSAFLFDFRTRIYEDTTLHAWWTPEHVQVTFYRNWPIDVTTSSNRVYTRVTVPRGGVISQPEEPTYRESRTSRYFTHWSTDRAGYYPFNFSAPIMYATTLFAQWVTERELVAQRLEEFRVLREEREANIVNQARTIPYDNIVRYPSNYSDEPIQVRVRIAQVMGGGSFRAYEVGTSNEWYIDYGTGWGEEPRILEGDTITFYGTFEGLTQVVRGLTGATAQIPRLFAVHRR